MQRFSCYRLVFALLALVGLVQAGCGDNASSPVPLKKVSGTVTYNGAPLPTGSITFMPVNGTNSAAGEIKDGKYSLATFTPGDGAPVGQYKVAITAWKTLPEMGQEGDPAIPKKYFDSEQSGLTANVSEEATQTHDFALQP